MNFYKNHVIRNEAEDDENKKTHESKRRVRREASDNYAYFFERVCFSMEFYFEDKEKLCAFCRSRPTLKYCRSQMYQIYCEYKPHDSLCPGGITTTTTSSPDTAGKYL